MTTKTARAAMSKFPWIVYVGNVAKGAYRTRAGAEKLAGLYTGAKIVNVFTAKKNPAAKKRAAPVKRAGVSAKKYVSRASQITGAPPSKRLKARRKTAVAKPRAGYFPNPALTYLVQVWLSRVERWETVGAFRLKEHAVEYAKGYAAVATTKVRVWIK